MNSATLKLRPLALATLLLFQFLVSMVISLLIGGARKLQTHFGLPKMLKTVGQSFVLVMCAFTLTLPYTAQAATTGIWTPSGAGGSAVVSGVTVTLGGADLSGTATATTLNNGGSGNYWSNPASPAYGPAPTTSTTPAISFIVGPFGTNGPVTITFSKPVTNPILQFARIGGQSGSSNSSIWTLGSWTTTTGNVSLLSLSKNSQLSVTSAVLQRPLTASLTGGLCLNGDANSTGCGSIQAVGVGITSLTFNITWAGPSNTVGDGIDLAVSIPDTSVNYKKTTIGGFGAFAFTGTNGVAGSTLTTSAGTNPAVSAISAIASNTAATTITETAVAGYAITSTACVDQNSVTAPSSLAGTVLTLPASSIPVVDGSTKSAMVALVRLRSLVPMVGLAKRSPLQHRVLVLQVPHKF
jgi:hypothetical protein